MIFLNVEHLGGRLPALTEQWRETATGTPPTVVIDDLLCSPQRQEIFDSFPADSWPEWCNISNSLQSKKLSCERIEIFPSTLSALVNELNSGPVLRFLEGLTGLDGLVPDPHLWGGGLHLMQPGGYLWPHTDFLQGQKINLMRVLNLILYVHAHWEPEMGGHFQIWNGDSVAQSILPKPGRCVIFQTDAHSIHGVSQVKGELTRKSIALFYYTIVEKPCISLDHTSGWRLTLSPEGSAIGGIRRRVAAALMRASFGLKRASIALNQKAEKVARSRWT